MVHSLGRRTFFGEDDSFHCSRVSIDGWMCRFCILFTFFFFFFLNILVDMSTLAWLWPVR